MPEKYVYGKNYNQLDPGFYIYRSTDSIAILEPKDLDDLAESEVKLIVDILNRKQLIY